MRSIFSHPWLFAILAPMMSGCASQSTVPFTAAPSGGGATELRVGVTPNYPPVVFKEGRELQGIEVDLARLVAKAMRVKLAFVEVPWDKLIPSLRAGAIDVIMAGMSVTEERSALVSFVQPYVQVGQMALIRSRDASRLAQPSALATPGRRVGVEKGTTGAQFALKHLTAATVLQCESVAQGVQALQEGRIEYLIHDAPTIWRLSGSPQFQDAGLMGLFTPLTEEHLAWAVRKTDEPLRKRLDAELSRLSERGELSAILNKWIPVRVEVAPARRAQ